MAFSKPGPNKRVCAFLIDVTIIHVIGVSISFLLAQDVSWLVFILIVLFKDCFNGQSVGKYWVGTQVIDDNGLPAAPAKTVIRNIFMCLPVMPLIEYIVMLRDKTEGKRLGDKVAKTKVNDLKPQISDGTFLWISLGLVVIMILFSLQSRS